ncbi:hypothetical protein EVAR_96005_1 [Eumeta japonica]|uniref:Uncharacterized protein n=1 Tax=Eumeta variegata TaxID=151549 RepID=A0A4C2AAL9_EUMVA|nr:hypothetical protein EVAR_96005_1 [Eumeta japonica]
MKETNGNGSHNGSSAGNSNTSSSNSISNMVGSRRGLASAPPRPIRHKENSLALAKAQNSHRKNKTTDSKCRQQQNKQTNSTNESESEEKETTETAQQSSVFESDSQRSYLTNEFDELESERHSLLETHDLLENSDHSLLEDDNNHSLLDDANSDVLMMQRHREMLAGLVDSNHLMKANGPVNGYALLDNNMYLGNERQISQIYQNNIEKELMMRERNREMMMRQNELLARQALMDKHYMPQSSIGLESANELLGANYQQRELVDTVRRSNAGRRGGVAWAGAAPYALQPRLLPQPQPQLVNGYDATAQQVGLPIVITNSQTEGRYLAENMDKFFTDFHKTQQMRLLLTRALRVGGPGGRRPGAGGRERLTLGHYESPRHMLSAERLELDHKQRYSGVRHGLALREAAGDADDDLDFDPFKETQKALAEMIENENMHTNMAPLVSGESSFNLCSSDGNLVRSRLPPPGFSHMNAFGVARRVPSATPRPAPHAPHTYTPSR